MTRRKGTASGPVRRGGGAGQRVKQFAVERGMRLPTPLVEIIAPDAPPSPYAVGSAVAGEIGRKGPGSSRKAAPAAPAKKAARKPVRAAPAKSTAARNAPAKTSRKPVRRKSR